MDEWLIENASLLTLGVVIVMFAIMIIMGAFMIRLYKQVEEARPINESADFIIEKLKQHLEHYSDISTILTLIERMDDEDPKLIEALQQYPQHAVDAGWAVYSKALSAALVVTTEALGEAMVRYNEDDTDLLSSHRQSNVAALQVKVDLLLHKLEAVRIRSEQSRKQSV